MASLHSIKLLLIGLLVPLGQVLATPSGFPEGGFNFTDEAPALFARQFTGYDHCNPAQTNKIHQALQDAAVMARQHTRNRGAQTYQSSPAYNNYFQPNEFSVVNAMLNAIGQQWQAPPPGKPGAGSPVQLRQFTTHITCEDSPVCRDASRGTSSYVVTDIKQAARNFVPSMRFCPLFFNPNEPRTKNNLDSLPYVQNPNRRQKSWCKPGNKFRDFEVAGTTVLHELTHLYEAGDRAGLASHPDGVGGQTKGTEDVYGTGHYSTDPQTAARQLHTDWVNAIKAKKPQKDRPHVPSNLNAESYAASATEWWFMSQCNLNSIA
ncbi:uncharacterized protein F4822DRAFT_443173 [Hypoxylon trugodes]|uniref:uncharacterized protein n=1 Tax=Hypoxylon trugodes TaxID=326681 RepID=UPI00218DFD15|nr:uncharacterized protein F4822DRAFT_443173 [Hypoxylon trugodes]KAI1390212.1 hypothetical protein F4822DRAFT_443173 [Hypoxylon trugodes]